MDSSLPTNSPQLTAQDVDGKVNALSDEGWPTAPEEGWPIAPEFYVKDDEVDGGRLAFSSSGGCSDITDSDEGDKGLGIASFSCPTGKGCYPMVIKRTGDSILFLWWMVRRH